MVWERVEKFLNLPMHYNLPRTETTILGKATSAAGFARNLNTNGKSGFLIIATWGNPIDTVGQILTW